MSSSAPLGEGETLARRLERGPLSLGDALKMAIAIAGALDKAHRQGVIHGDVKPANVMLGDGGPTLLDVGVSGVNADARTDIFALGTMVHEMVAGQKDTPGALVHVVNVCLAKDPKDRWQTARDLLAELEWVAAGGADTIIATPIPAASHKRQQVLRASLVAAALVAAATALPAWRYWRGEAEPEFRFRIPLAYGGEPMTGNSNPVSGGQFALSPDGRSIAYVTQSGRATATPRMLYVRPIGSITPQPLAGTEDAQFPFWSADGRSIAFSAGGKLKRVNAAGGLPQDICEIPEGAIRAQGTAVPLGGTWNGDGTIVLGTPKGLVRVSHQGGTPEAITTLEKSETAHAYPQFLPDGRHILYFAAAGEGAGAKGAIFVGALDSKDRIRVMAAESPAQYVEPGFLLFHRDQTLYAQPFSARTMALSGDAVGVAADTFHFSASPNGVLAYYYRSTANTAPAPTLNVASQLTWGERTTQTLETVGPPGNYQGVSLSPDDRRIAVHRHDGAGGDVFVIEPKPRDSITRLTLDASHDNSMPIWSPNGDRVVYSALQKGKWGLYQTLSDGSGKEELLFESELLKVPLSWSFDGKRIVFSVQDPKTNGDLWVLDMEAVKDRKATPFIQSTFDEKHGQISPDGKWIAYTTNETNGRNEIFVRPFPSGSGLYQVSDNGGWFPRWRGDSKELYYKAIGNATTPGVQANGSAPTGPYYAVAVRAKGAAFEHDKPRDILNFRLLLDAHSGGSFQPYDVSADGQRVLYLQDVTSAPTAQTTTVQTAPDPTNGLVIALNWIRGLKK
jgi:Tol biopolymer transport system component